MYSESSTYALEAKRGKENCSGVSSVYVWGLETLLRPRRVTCSLGFSNLHSTVYHPHIYRPHVYHPHSTVYHLFTHLWGGPGDVSRVEPGYNSEVRPSPRAPSDTAAHQVAVIT